MSRRTERQQLIAGLTAAGIDPMLWRYPARVVNEYDGDTIRLDIDLGFGQVMLAYHPFSGNLMLSARVLHINAPELKLKDPVLHKYVISAPGQEALAYAQQLLPTGLMVVVQTHEWDEYRGRYLASITLPDGRDFANEMLISGHAEVYGG